MKTPKELLRQAIAAIYGENLGFGFLFIFPVAAVIAVVVATVVAVKFKRRWIFAVPFGLVAGIGATAAWTRIVSARRAAPLAAHRAAALTATQPAAGPRMIRSGTATQTSPNPSSTGAVVIQPQTS